MTTALEVILLSFALGDRYRTYKREKEAAIQEANTIQQEALDSLRETNKLKDEFLSITSHELQTPLNGIIGLAETMRAGAVGTVNPKMDAHLTMIMKSGERLSHLIHDILDYTNLKNEQMKMELGPVRLYEITNIVLTVCQPLIKDKPIQLVNKIERSSNLTVLADENRLQQILYNLVGNAIKFTEEGTISISARTEQNFVRINVSDTGKGIPLEMQTAIFDEFYQVEDDKIREHGGSGIGLNITKRLVENHGGEIRVDSTLHQGSSFSFTMPLYLGEEMPSERLEEIVPFAEKTSAIVEADQEAVPPPVVASTILIADDDAVNLQVLMNQLNLSGYKVITAASGQEVLEVIDKEHIDLLILDIMMPKMSGYEVSQELRKQYSLIELPILMLTAKAQLNDKITAFEVGANDYLEKPCQREELLARVNTLLQLRYLNNELKRMNLRLEDKVKQRTEALEVANTHLEQLAASRTRLLASISHDLGTPVTVIYNYMQALEAGIIKEDEKEAYLQLVYNKIHILNRLISDLFDLSKLESKQLDLNIEERNVRHYIEDIKEKWQLEMLHANRQFNFISGYIDASIVFYIDEQRMEQVFSNLIWNAVHHTSSAKGKIEMEIMIDKDEERLIFLVSDNGAGIDEERLPFIFERYYKVAKADGRYGGAGIGLAIVQELVKAHSGEVWVTSELDVGSTFYVSLPFY